MSRSATDPETGLTPKMEAFCVEFAKTGNASDAYRKAYDAARMKPETIAVRASELQKNGKIAVRLSQLRSDARKASGITLAEHLNALRSLREDAREAGQFGAAVSAEMGRGKASGLYSDASHDEDLPAVTRVEITVKDGRKAG